MLFGDHSFELYAMKCECGWLLIGRIGIGTPHHRLFYRRHFYVAKSFLCQIWSQFNVHPPNALNSVQFRRFSQLVRVSRFFYRWLSNSWFMWISIDARLSYRLSIVSRFLVEFWVEWLRVRWQRFDCYRRKETFGSQCSLVFSRIFRYHSLRSTWFQMIIHIHFM